MLCQWLPSPPAGLYGDLSYAPALKLSVAVRAGAYVFGSSGDQCPSGSTRITDDTMCQSAATAYGVTRVTTSDANVPSGCSALLSGTAIPVVSFDAAGTGSFSSNRRPMCIIGPSPPCGRTLTTSAPGLIRSSRGSAVLVRVLYEYGYYPCASLLPCTQTRGCAVPVPSVSLQAPTNAPTSGGALVTIFGLNFGTTDSSSSASLVSIAGISTPCGTTSWFSDSSVQCQSPGGLGTKTSPVVTVGGMVGTGPASFTYDGTECGAAGRRGRCA